MPAMMRTKYSSLLAAAGLAVVALGGAASGLSAGVTELRTELRDIRSTAKAFDQPAKSDRHGSSSPEQKAAWLRYRSTRKRGGYPAPGWPIAHDRRSAKKRRNQARHRRACKAGHPARARRAAAGRHQYRQRAGRSW